MYKMKYFSMFSGIGGFEYGIGNKGECVGYCEIEKNAIAIYKNHYSHHKNYGDVTKIRTEEIPDFDILVGGFPCQPFSFAGKRKGFNDTRGTLFFDIVRILKDKKPKHIFLENVKGLLNHKSGWTFYKIIKILTELGYILQWQVINTQQIRVPQSRDRLFIVGHFGKFPRAKILPIRGEKQKPIKLLCQITGKTPSGISRQCDRIYSMDGISPTLCASFSRNNMFKIAKYNNGIIDKNTIRVLTPIECERLQGFPDNWSQYGIYDNKKKEINESIRYKCLGNAVTTNVISVIFNRIYTIHIKYLQYLKYIKNKQNYSTSK